MKVLLVAATPFESRLIATQSEAGTLVGKPLKLNFPNLEAELLVTGIGMVNTAFHLGKYFAQTRPELAIHFGVAGAINRNFQPPTLVEIVLDQFWKMGAEDKNEFLDMEKMGFPIIETEAGKVFTSLSNPSPSPFQLAKVSGLTSNTVHGKETSINDIIQNLHPDIETMESAAFFQACLIENIPFWSFRGISNLVEPRNRENWKLQEAATGVQEFVLQALAKI